MIKEYLVCVAVAVGFSVYQYNEPPAPLTSAQLQQKAKAQSKANVCKRLKRGAKYDRLCGPRGSYAVY
jgi:hypothetical protein